jgi:peptidoglycan/xylan/chitin deacetylase (PgdA/CDA1 family)
MKDIKTTTVMYHYVRPIAKSKFPKINALDVSNFRNQLLYFKKKYSPISLNDLQNLIVDQDFELPPNPLLLTFDDGYKDNFDYALPIMDELGFSAVFFIPVSSVEDNKVLQVNKIHYILAALDSVSELIKYVENRVSKLTHLNHHIKSLDEYRGLYMLKSKYDAPGVNYLKKLLQKALPEEFRIEIINDLFTKYVTVDETAFSEELYMQKDQLKFLIRNGFYIGGHSYSHNWLNEQDNLTQELEFVKSKEFLLNLGVDLSTLSFAYPFGGYNNHTLDLMHKHDFKIGFTTKVDFSLCNFENRYTLERFNTNDFMKCEL